MSDRMACGCVLRDIPGGRDLSWAPGEAISVEVTEPCRIHEDYAKDLVLDVARLARAMLTTRNVYSTHSGSSQKAREKAYLVAAADLAAEYARLAPVEPT